MKNVWVSAGSTTIESMVNPIAAACAGDGIADPFIPDTVHFLDNPGLGDAIPTAAAITEVVLEQYGVEDPIIETTQIDHETEFDSIVAHFRNAIQAAHEEDANVAVDMTPGRKFMSVIAFNAGTTFDADHIFYFYLHSSDHYGKMYPEIPDPAAELYDFVEVI